MGTWRPRSFGECWTIFWRRKLLISLFAAGTALAALIVAGEIPSAYQSQALLVISEQAVRNSEGLSARMAAAREQATSASNLEPLIERYHFRDAGETMDSAVQRMRKAMKIETKLSDYYPQVPETVTISFRHRDPTAAQQILKDFLSTFEEANETIRKRTESEANWLSAQVAELESQLAGLGPPGFITPEPAAATADVRTARLTLLSTIEALNDKQYALEQQIAEQKRQILEQERLVRSDQNTAPKDSAYGALLVRKAELDAQLAEYATQYTEKNSKVVQAKTQLSEIDRQLSALEAKSRSGAATDPPAVRDLLALQRDLIRLQTELEITRRETGRKQAALGSMPETGNPAPAKHASDATRAKAEAAARYDRLNKRYNSLIEQRDSIQKSGVLRGDVPPLFQIVEPRHLPPQPVGPNRLMLQSVALALALGVGLLVVPIAEGRRLTTIQDHRDVEYYLGVPVLGLIPETLTPLERSLKWRSNFVIRIGVLLLAAMMPAVALALRHFAILQRVFQ